MLLLWRFLFPPHRHLNSARGHTRMAYTGTCSRMKVKQRLCIVVCPHHHRLTYSVIPWEVVLIPIWLLSFLAFKNLEDPLCAAEKKRCKIAQGLVGNEDEADSMLDWIMFFVCSVNLPHMRNQDINFSPASVFLSMILLWNFLPTKGWAARGLKYFKMFLNVFKCFLNVQECFWMFLNVFKYSEMFLNVLKCSRMFLNICECSKTFWRMFKNIHKCF